MTARRSVQSEKNVQKVMFSTTSFSRAITAHEAAALRSGVLCSISSGLLLLIADHDQVVVQIL